MSNKRRKERKNQDCEIIKPGLLKGFEGKVDKKNVVLLMPRLWERKLKQKAPIVGMKLSLDLGKKFDKSEEKIINIG